MITSGFFNSVEGDRRYNADQMSQMFEGLIGGGVFESVGQKFKVEENSGMTVKVGTGRAIVDTNWIRSDAVVSVPISAAHVSLNRYTLVILRKSSADRTVTLTTKDGTPASTPAVPSLTRSGGVYEICLAKVYVAAGATSIAAANITDTRADSTVCGYVTGLIEQVDTSDIMDQWEAAYADAEASLQSDAADFSQEAASLMAAEQSAFMSWFDDLTANLRVETYLQKYSFSGTPASLSSTTIAWSDLTPNAYTYISNDIITVHINGLLAALGTDYTVTNSGISLSQLTSSSTALVEVEIIKSRIGSNTDNDLALIPLAAGASTFSAGDIATYTGEVGKRYLAIIATHGDTKTGNIDINNSTPGTTSYSIASAFGETPKTDVELKIIRNTILDPVIRFSASNTQSGDADGNTVYAIYKLFDNIPDTAKIESRQNRSWNAPFDSTFKNLLLHDDVWDRIYILVAMSFGSSDFNGEIDDGLVLSVSGGNLVSIMSERDDIDYFSQGAVKAMQISANCEMAAAYIKVRAKSYANVRMQFSSSASAIAYWLIEYFPR